MEALYQIGKDLAALDARVKKLETEECNCKSKGKISERKLPKEQQEIVKKLRSNHEKIFAELNAVLKKFELPVSLVIGEFHLVDKGKIMEGDDVDMCCMCCTDGSDGYEYCCDYNGCGCCS